MQQTTNLDPQDEPVDESGNSQGNPFDQLKIGGVLFVDTPVRVTGPGLRHKYEKKDAGGSSGGVQGYKGTEPTEFTISWLLWKPEHFDRWSDLAAIIAPPEAKKQPAKVPVEHPLLAFLSQSGREFFVDNVLPPEAEGDAIRVSVQITAAMPAKPAAKKTTNPKSSSGEATSQAQKVYDDLAKELANTNDPIRQRQIRTLQDDIARRHPSIKRASAPSKSAINP